MAISDITRAYAGLQPTVYFAKTTLSTNIGGQPTSLWSTTGFPVAGSAGAGSPGTRFSSTSAQVTGQLTFRDPSGTDSSYIASVNVSAPGTGTLVIADRLWSNNMNLSATTTANPGATMTGTRDDNGSSNGVGYLVGLEVITATTNASTISISYTNSAGTTGRTGTEIFSLRAGAIAGHFYPIGLQSGDDGVRRVQSITLGSATGAGTVGLVVYRPLAFVEVQKGTTTHNIDSITGGFTKLYPGTVPFLIWIPAGTTTGAVCGSVSFTNG